MISSFKTMLAAIFFDVNVSLGINTFRAVRKMAEAGDMQRAKLFANFIYESLCAGSEPILLVRLYQSCCPG